jgi:hypothetical protein
MATDDNPPPEREQRQQAWPAVSAKTREWSDLLILRRDNQAVVALCLFLIALGFGGWYLWRSTTVPGLIELDRSEPANSKLVVNVNTADAAELMLLPEVGIKMAHLIVEDRLANGPFRDAEEFGLRIKGIGARTLPKMTPYLEGWTNERPSN